MSLGMSTGMNTDMGTAFRPVLGSSCARATTAAEMRFRIDRPIRGRRGARIIGLDEGANAIVRHIAGGPWGHARFFSLAGPVGDGGSESVLLRDADGLESNLLAELDDADVVIMVATTEADGTAATIIGAACTVRAIMTAGLVIGEPAVVGATVAAIRPHARVLMVSGDEHDVVDLLSALRA
jgi:hypothetical protein